MSAPKWRICVKTVIVQTLLVLSCVHVTKDTHLMKRNPDVLASLIILF